MKVGPFEILVSDACPEDAMFLLSGSLSRAGELERAMRVQAGENDARVYAEIMVRERRAAVIKLAPPPGGKR